MLARPRSFVSPLVLALAAAAAAAQSPWTVTFLHPAGATQSYANGVDAGASCGYSAVVYLEHARLWPHGTTTPIDLDPGGGYSRIWACANGAQVGEAGVGAQGHASLWHGSSATWVDLHPAGAIWSVAYDVFGSQQVGYTSPTYSIGHAALWSSSAASWVDLHPAGATSSFASGTDGSTQVGAVFWHASNESRACLWKGSAASFVVLHPQGAASSRARAVSGPIQVGFVTFAGSAENAARWNGSSSSYVNLFPGGPNVDSAAYDIWGTLIVGYANGEAAAWSGPAATYENLRLALPANWAATRATSVWHRAGKTHVGGYGWNLSTGRNEALLWSRVEAP